MPRKRPTALCVTMLAVAFTLTSPSTGVSQQRQAVQTERMLVLAPIPSDPGDSAFAVLLGDELRSSLEGKTRRRLTVISKDRIGEALEASGFGRDALLDLAASEQLARFLQADGYLVGWVGGNPARRVDLRFINLRRSGFGGWIHYQGQPNATAEQMVEAIGQQLEAHVRAAEQTRECLERRDRRDFQGAKDRARRAFESVPNHSGAASCLAVVLEVERAPADSIVKALEMAVKGDSLDSRAWEMLGRQYQAAGDSLKGAEAFAKQLEADPSDMRLRMGVAALFITLKQYERARGIIDEGLKQNPSDLQALQLKARACEDGSLWPCLLEALTAQYEVDSSLAGNLEFYGKVIGAAQQANNNSAALRWTQEAVRRVPDNIQFWRARAAAFTEAGMTDSALAAYRRITQLEPTDIGSLIRIVQLQTDTSRFKIDSVPQLDRETRSRVASRVDSLIRRRAVPAAKRDSVVRALEREDHGRRLEQQLRPIDSLLQRVIALRSNNNGQPTDTAVWMNVAVMYFRPATQMVQTRVRPDLAIAWLEKAKAYDVRRQLTTQADFFLGLSYMINMSSVFDFTAISESKNCRSLASLDEYLKKLRASMTAGASVQPATAQQVLSNIEGIEKYVVEAGRAWKCS